MHELLKNKFGGKTRIRVCGILIENNQILLAEHDSINNNGTVWLPPGGGVSLGESLEEALKREFLEETGLDISVEEFLFNYEFIKEPFHAIEIYFRVKRTGGKLIKGTDPELGTNEQIIHEVKFVTIEEISVMSNKNKHEILRNLPDLGDLFKIRGLWRSK